MPMELFGPANQIGQGVVRALLPDGRQEGDEWVAKNPCRPDQHAGSLKVNLKSGRWCDFAIPDEARGNDFVSLYAYLNEDRLRAKAERHKNYRSGLQFEAARDMLTTYDNTYFPDTTDYLGTADKDSGSKFWDSWHEVPEGIEDPPKLDLSWYQKNWGKCEDQWEFTVDGKIVMYACRFRDSEKKKQDRPFTLWTNGDEYKWRAKAPSGKYTLWGIDELEEHPNRKVLLVEGQKAAAKLAEIVSEYICIGWYGGTNAIDKQDWEPLSSRVVYYSFDADSPGRKTVPKIKKILEEINTKVTIVYPPDDCKKGWDLADAILDGWSEADLIKHVENDKKEDEGFVDDNDVFEFEILGYSNGGGEIWFYPHHSRQIVKYKANMITSGVLRALQDQTLYAKYFTKEDGGGIAWSTAANMVIQAAGKKPIFSHSKVRGTGCWKDQGHLIINTGEKLIVNGETKELYDAPGEYIYERGNFVPFCTEPPLSTEESAKIKMLCNKIEWKHDIFGDFLAGWLTLAPFGGALEWRPYCWLTGPVGGGKSWILNNIAHPLVSRNYGIFARGTSTSAGIRNKLSNNSLATIIDEMEADNPKTAEDIENNLRMFREGSSGSEGGAATFHGTSDGEGREWIVQSMALFASVGAGIKHGADRSRFTELTLRKFSGNDIKDREKKFLDLEEAARIITPTWANAYHARTHEIFFELEKCIRIMTKQTTELFGNRRQGDQIGTLLAGAWMSDHDISITAAEAEDYIKIINIEAITGEFAEKPDEELILDEILASHIEITEDGYSKRYTVGTILNYWFSANLALVPNDVLGLNVDLSKLKNELEQYGIKPKTYNEKNTICIAISHPAIRKMLRETAWTNVYDSLLGRLDFCDGKIKGPTRFAGVAKRYRELDAKEVLDAVPF